MSKKYMKVHATLTLRNTNISEITSKMGDDSKGTGWMYNPVSEINREDYLLGKKIGKDFDAEGTMGKINDVEYDCTPASIFSSQAS